MTKTEIIKQYNEICNIMKECKTVKDARKLEKILKTTIEIGTYDDAGYPCMESKFDKTEPSDIEWFRVEDYELLSCIYFYFNGSVRFDVPKNDDLYWLDYVSIEDIKEMNETEFE